MIITNIHDILPALEGRKDFIIGEKDGYKFIDYVVVLPDSFDDSRRMECRGIKFGSDGRLLARPFQKFFNIGEKQQLGDIDWSQDHVVLEKLDGSMIHPAVLNGEIRLMTRKGVTDVAKKAEERFLKRINYMRFLHDNIAFDWTPIFEFTAPDNRVVLRYDDSALTLTGLRRTSTGEHAPWDWMQERAANYDIPVVKAYGEVDDAARFMARTRALIGEEGYVVRFADGHMLKVKAEDYLKQHRAKEDLDSKKKVLAIVLGMNGHIDDFVPLLDDSDRRELQEFNDNVWNLIMKMTNIVGYHVEQWRHRGHSRKEIALLMDDQESRAMPFPPCFRQSVFSVLDGETPLAAVLKAAYKNPQVITVPWRGE